jgi:hypothetical protein
MVTERVLRGLIRTVARKLKNTSLTAKESLLLLQEQRKLAKQLQASNAAQTVMDRQAETDLKVARRIAAACGNNATEKLPNDGPRDGA